MSAKAWRFGDNVNTDEIIPARYLNTSEAKELAAHVMEDCRADFASNVAPGDVVVAGENFGCGSSREHAPLALKTAGVSCLVAKSFARIFLRNAINIGLAVIEQAEAADGTSEGDELDVDPGAGSIRNLTTGKSYQAEPLPLELREIIEAGGLMAYVEKELRK